MPIIEVEVTEAMIDKAYAEAEKIGKLSNSILAGRGNIAGVLGELVYVKHAGGKWKPTRDYDVVRGDKKKVDVKTGQCMYAPTPEHQVNVAVTSAKQRCDILVFCRVTYDLSRAWLVGEMPKTLYFERARFIRAGEYDASNNHTPTRSAWNMKIAELYPVKCDKVQSKAR